MKTYKVNGVSASSTGPKTAVSLTGGTTYRPLVNYLLFGFRTNPSTTDQQVRITVAPTTTAGTGSAATPLPDDPQDVAASTTALTALSAEPTGSATPPYFLDFDLNQRASKEWGCQDGRELAGAKTASNGICSTMVLVTAGLVMSCVMGWRE